MLYKKKLKMSLGYYRMLRRVLESAKRREYDGEEVEHDENQYAALINDILNEGTMVIGRNGNTKAVCGSSMHFSLKDGTIPLLTTKKVAWKTCLKELLWFISGCTSNEVLQAKNVKIWNGNGSREFLDSRGLTNLRENDLGHEYGMEGVTYWTATNIYVNHTTLSGITMNFLMSLSGGLLAGYLISGKDPFWTYSSGLAGIICASAGNDLYHPIQSMIIAMIGVVVAYKLHYWVERKFKIDDAVGAVAVHGYAGVAGLIICGFVLNGYPSSGYSVGAMWVGTDYAPINPLGMFIGAIIMFGVLGLIPGWIIAKVLHGMGKLRIPREVEIAGLDYEIMETAKKDERAVSSATR